MNTSALPNWIDEERGEVPPAHGVARYLDNQGVIRPRWSPGIEQSHRVYFVQSLSGGPVKIGFTANLEQRLRQLQTASPTPLRVIESLIGTRRIEALIHRMLRRYRINGEWYEIDEDRIAFVRARLYEEGLAA